MGIFGWCNVWLGFKITCDNTQSGAESVMVDVAEDDNIGNNEPAAYGDTQAGG